MKGWPAEMKYGIYTVTAKTEADYAYGYVFAYSHPVK